MTINPSCPAALWGACLVFALTAAAVPTESPLRAGVARIDITPTSPVTLAGYESRKELSRGVHDPLSARAVAFEHEGRRLVLISTDILGFYNGTAEVLRKSIIDACGLKPAELFLAAIHTHSAPTPTLDSTKGHSNNVAYMQTLEGQLIQVTLAALAELTPTLVAAGSGSSPVGANRRQVVQDAAGQSRIELGRNPATLTDREVQVLSLTRAGNAELAAVVFDYATHSTSLGPRNYLISGDVHGLAAQFVERHLGHGVVAPVFAGASGDIDPWYRVLPEFNTTNGWIPEPVLMGTMLGEEVAHVLAGMQPPRSTIPVRTALKTLQLPGKPKGESLPAGESPPVSFNVTVGRVGEVAFVGLGGEVFNEIGKTIKTSSPFPLTIVITHCNGAAGYLPTRAAYAEGGYEVRSSPFGPGAAELVAEEALGLLRKLRN